MTQHKPPPENLGISYAKNSLGSTRNHQAPLISYRCLAMALPLSGKLLWHIPETSILTFLVMVSGAGHSKVDGMQ